MADRIALLMDIARVNQLHSSECAFLRAAMEARKIGYQPPHLPRCDCWLSRPPGQEETGAAVDLRTHLPSPEEVEWAFGYLYDIAYSGEIFGMYPDGPAVRALKHLLTEFDDMRGRIRDLEK